MASGSLQYEEDWRAGVTRLAAASRRHLYLTRLPLSLGASFVTVQRPHAYGYATEYTSWFISKDELLEHARGLGLRLMRELLDEDRPLVRNAPAPMQHRGFLFEA